MEDVEGPAPGPQRRFLLAWLPPVGWAALLLVLSAQPASSLPDPGFTVPDKLVHGILYAVLGALVARALARRRRALVFAALVALLCVFAFGLFDELTQTLSPGRSPDLADAAADAIGATAGFLAAMRYYRR